MTANELLSAAGRNGPARLKIYKPFYLVPVRCISGRNFPGEPLEWPKPLSAKTSSADFRPAGGVDDKTSGVKCFECSKRFLRAPETRGGASRRRPTRGSRADLMFARASRPEATWNAAQISQKVAPSASSPSTRRPPAAPRQLPDRVERKRARSNHSDWPTAAPRVLWGAIIVLNFPGRFQSRPCLTSYQVARRRVVSHFLTVLLFILIVAPASPRGPVESIVGSVSCRWPRQICADLWRQMKNSKTNQPTTGWPPQLTTNRPTSARNQPTNLKTSSPSSESAPGGWPQGQSGSGLDSERPAGGERRAASGWEWPRGASRPIVVQLANCRRLGLVVVAADGGHVAGPIARRRA